jgi:hypothetical protein
MNHHIVPTRALSLDFRVDAPPAIGSGPRRLVHNRYIVENWNLGWLAYCIFGSIVSTEKLRAALEGRWIVGSLDRWIDVGFVEPQSTTKSPSPAASTRQETGTRVTALHQHHRRTHQCLQLLFTHRSSGEKEQQPRATNLSTDPREVTARRFTAIYWRPTSSRIFHLCQRQFPTKRAIERTQKTSVGLNFHGGILRWRF